jgi:hypothetical protein
MDYHMVIIITIRITLFLQINKHYNCTNKLLYGYYNIRVTPLFNELYLPAPTLLNQNFKTV